MPVPTIPMPSSAPPAWPRRSTGSRPASRQARLPPTPTRAASRRTSCCRPRWGRRARPRSCRRRCPARAPGGAMPRSASSAFARSRTSTRRWPRTRSTRAGRTGAQRGARPRARGARRRQRARLRARLRLHLGLQSGSHRPGDRRAARSRGACRIPRPRSGIADPHGAWVELEHRLGCAVFEIPTLPPSVPGMRVHKSLHEALRRAGGRAEPQCLAPPEPSTRAGG